MGFELTVTSHTPLTAVHDRETVAIEFLRTLGFLGSGDEDAARASVPYRLLFERFLAEPARLWAVEELITSLETTRPTLYRHLNKLKGLDLLEERVLPEGGQKAYRLRYASLKKAWNFVEANVDASMDNYRETLDRIQALLPTPDRAAATAKPAGSGPTLKRRGFEIRVASNLPLEGDDPNALLAEHFHRIGFLPSSDPSDMKDAAPYRILVDAFLARPDKLWTIDELLTRLETTRPTVYRHLNRLKSLDLLEEAQLEGDGDGSANPRKGYRIRYGSLAKAWNFVEANVRVAMDNYRKTVDHVHRLLTREVTR